MANKIIKEEQLSRLVSKIKTDIDKALRHLPYGKVTSSSSTVVTATVDNFTAYETGAVCIIKNGSATSASGWTLNVNGLGAKKVYVTTADTTASTTQFAANHTMMFIYDESLNSNAGGWRICQLFNSNTTYSNASLGQGYATCTTAPSTTAKTATLSSYDLVIGGVVVVKFSYNVLAGATLNVNSKGAAPMYYRGSAITAGVINEGDVAYFMYQKIAPTTGAYVLLGVDRWAQDRIEIIDLT